MSQQTSFFFDMFLIIVFKNCKNLIVQLPAIRMSFLGGLSSFTSSKAGGGGGGGVIVCKYFIVSIYNVNKARGPPEI